MATTSAGEGDREVPIVSRVSVLQVGCEADAQNRPRTSRTSTSLMPLMTAIRTTSFVEVR
jgi:hypothetical protein